MQQMVSLKNYSQRNIFLNLQANSNLHHELHAMPSNRLPPPPPRNNIIDTPLERNSYNLCTPGYYISIELLKCIIHVYNTAQT